jgi:hypothetical protein
MIVEKKTDVDNNKTKGIRMMSLIEELKLMIAIFMKKIRNLGTKFNSFTP